MMGILADILVGSVAILHVLFLILEMYFWDKPLGLRLLGHSQESAAAAKILAMNQGLYNGFLAAGLVWSLVLGPAGDSIKIFILLCVVIAGVFGGLTANRKILLVQALPAAAALVLVLLG